MKKKVAIVSIGYVWFPCEQGPLRFYYLAKLFAEQGYDVDVITSNFQHFKKEYRDIENIKAQNYPFNIVFVEVPKYKKNLDLRRICSNIVAEKEIMKHFKKNGEQYDAVYCTVPANNIAASVSKYCKVKNIPFIADIEDLWPEAMSMALKIPVISDVLFYPFKRDAEVIYKNADAVIGTSDEYTSRAFKYQNRDIPHETVYVGCDLEKFDAGVQEFAASIEKGEEEFWVSYAGSIGTSYDIKTLILAAKEIEKRGYQDLRFKIMGTGPKLEEMKILASELACSNVEIMGYIAYPKMAAYLAKSDVTVNSFIKGAPQSIVNKIGDYLASGCAMINTLENDEFVKMVEREKFGVNVEPENVVVLADAVEKLYKNKLLCAKMGNKAREFGEDRFSVSKGYRRIVDMVEGQIHVRGKR